MKKAIDNYILLTKNNGKINLEKLSKAVKKEGHSIKKSVDFISKDDKKRIVYGVVYEPDTVDLQGDFATAEEIEKGAHLFMKESQTISNRHESLMDRNMAYPVESYIAPTDLNLGNTTIKKGSWVMGTKIVDNDMWDAVEKGEIQAYSMEGMAENVNEGNTNA